MGVPIDPEFGATAPATADGAGPSSVAESPPSATDPRRRAHLRDGVLVAVVTLATWVACGIFNVT